MAKKKTNPYADAPYEVGKGKPPKHSQIKPGEVRNPRGRGKKPPVDTRARDTMERLLDQTIPIRTGEAVIYVTAYEALMTMQLQKAIKGDHRSSDFFLKEAQRVGLMRSEPAPPETTHRGVLVVPQRSATEEEWERDYGQPMQEAEMRREAEMKELLAHKVPGPPPPPAPVAPVKDKGPDLWKPVIPRFPGFETKPEKPRVIPESEKQLAVIRDHMEKTRQRELEEKSEQEEMRKRASR